MMPPDPAFSSPDDATGEMLCRIYLKVLATLTRDRLHWVRGHPHTSALAYVLKVLGLPCENSTPWQKMVTLGWIEQRTTASGDELRLTLLGRTVVQTSPPILPTSPTWYARVLHHLYRPDKNLPGTAGLATTLNTIAPVLPNLQIHSR
jgi:hypothetical protein